MFSSVVIPIYTLPIVYKGSFFHILTTSVSDYLLSTNRALGLVLGIGAAALGTIKHDPCHCKRLDDPGLFANYSSSPSLPAPPPPSGPGLGRGGTVFL